MLVDDFSGTAVGGAGNCCGAAEFLFDTELGPLAAGIDGAEEIAATDAVVSAAGTAGDIVARGFTSCDHPIRATMATAAPAPANAKFLDRVCALFLAASIAPETDALNDTDAGYDGPLSFDRTALKSFAMSIAFW